MTSYNNFDIYMSTKNLDSLNPKHLEELKKSGLSDETIKAANIISVSAEKAEQLIGFNCGAGWAVPYYGLNGEPPVWQVKPDIPFKFSDGKEAKYLWKKGQPNRIYFPPMIIKSILSNPKQFLVITEGVKKALSATQNGFPSIAFSGVWNWIKDGAAIPDMDFIKWQGRKVYISFDSDATTKQSVCLALFRLYKELLRRGANVLIANLPSIDGLDKTGLDDFLVIKGKDEYSKLLSSATDFYEWYINQIKNFNGVIRDNLLKELIQFVATESVITKERVSNLLKHANILSKQAFNQVLKEVSTISVPQQNETQTISAEDEKEAMALLKDPNLIEKLIDDLERIGFIGDDENKIALYLAFTSRKLDSPINVVMKSESSAGKSFEVGTVLKFIPKQDYLEFSRITPNALYYRKDNLAHKIIVIFERPGAEAADYSLRTLQSEKKLIISTTQKNPETGNWEAADIEVAGPIAYVETTTKAQINEENETRCFELFVDESPEQTAKIFKAQNAKYIGQDVDIEAIAKPWQNAQRLLKPYPVLIPFIEHIKFPDNPLRVRRDRSRFLALIEASAFLHQYQREKKIVNGKEYVVADINDYGIAFYLANEILKHVFTGLSPRLKQLLDALAKIVEDKVAVEGGKAEEKEITIKELLPVLGWNRKTLKKYLDAGNNKGYVEITNSGKGKLYTVKLIKPPTGFDELLLPPDKLMKVVQLSTDVQMGNGQVNPLKNIENTQPVQMGTEYV